MSEGQRDTYGEWFQDIQNRIAGGTSYYEWTISAQELLKAVYGEHSAYYRTFCDFLHTDYTGPLESIFYSAKRDYERGFNVGDIHLRISGRVLGDFIALAKLSLDSGCIEVASVLAAAALEDVLKRYAVTHGLEIEDRTMTQVINALKSKGLFNRGTSKLLDGMPKIRDLALHAEWDKLTEVEIGSIIGCVEQFLQKYFSYSKLF